MKTQSSVIDITELRIKLDQINEKIISNLKYRSRYALNEGNFTKEFYNKNTWFDYRLKKEQDIDSEFGRFLFHDQSPFVFKKEELLEAKIKRIISNSGIEPIIIDLSTEIMDLYKKMLKELCEAREDESTYGETTKLDVETVLALNERIVGIGGQVAAYKLQNHPELLKAESREQILAVLINPKRETEVIEKTIEIAKNYGLKNLDLIVELAKKLIEITTKTEIEFILDAQKKANK